MKIASLILVCIALCSFSGEKANNTWNDWQLKGKVKRIVDYEYFGHQKKELTDKRIYAFDERGNLIADTGSANTDHPMICSWDHRYNTEGNKTEENIYGADRVLSWKTIYSYDKDGRLMEDKRYHENGALEQTNVYKYVHGNSESVSYGASGKINDITTIKYDAYGNLIEKTTIDSFSIAWNGDAYKTVITSDRERKYSEQTAYNIRNEPTHTYTFQETRWDSMGNWTERTMTTQYKGIVDTFLYKREITYY